jgi:predicted ATP-binding protein involved in virulence
MKIRKLQLKNIGVFDDETIEFQECPAKDKAEIHILTGENGSGKTTILQALVSFFNITLVEATSPNSPSSDINGIIEVSPYTNSFYKKIQSGNHEKNPKIVYGVTDEGEIFDYPFEYFTNADDGSPCFGNLCFTGYKRHPTVELLSYAKLLRSEGQISKASLLGFGVFAFSGYRQIENEKVQASYLPKDFNPLSQSLEFVKDYRKEGEITINQLVANNISNRALSKEDGSLEESKKYETVINSIETFIKDVTDYEVKFVLKRSPNELKIRMHGEELDFDVLPDGLRSLISWIADLLGRIDLLKWQDDLPITEKNLILFLDEIEVHLHPAWQRKVLPIVQELFKNAQIFVSTHSPFVVNSVDDAWVYKLKVKDGKATCEEPIRSEDALSYRYVLRNTFDIENEFGIEIEKRLNDFYKERDTVLAGNGNSKKAKSELKKIAKELSKQSKELKSKVDFELFQLSEITGEEF